MLGTKCNDYEFETIQCLPAELLPTFVKLVTRNFF